MILKYMKKKEWALIAFCVLLITGQVWLDLKIPDYMSSITMAITTGGSMDSVIGYGGWMLACALSSFALAIITSLIATWIATSLAMRLRELQFEKVESFSMNEINKFSTASLITRSTNDITQIQTAFSMGMQVIIKAPIMAVMAIAKISSKSWEWTMATGVSIVLILTVVGILLAYVFPRFKKIQWLTDDLNRVTRENLTGLRVVRAYNAEKYQEAKFEDANKNLTDLNLSTNRAMSVMMPAMMLVLNTLSLSIYWIGAFLIAAAGGIMVQLEIFSNMVVFLSYAMQVVMAFIMIVMILFILPRAMVSSKRIQEILNTEPSIKDGTVTESPVGKEGEIVFKDVCFKYPDAKDYVIKDVNLEISKGDVVAFIGSTGSGKSSLVNLIPRFYDVTEGEVLVDGVNVKDYTQEALHAKIGYVPQKTQLFSGTVASNVAFGDVDGTEDNVRKAISIAQASEFVNRLEKGLDGEVSQGGTNLSGGQKQRLSIARAIAKKPEFYIFDDSFSALDYKTDRILRDALRKETGGVTSLIVAQRIGTIMDADKIVVIDNGRVAGVGTHDELMKGCDTYREIAFSQLSEKELGL